jgi:hypothetical protein
MAKIGVNALVKSLFLCILFNIILIIGFSIILICLIIKVIGVLSVNQAGYNLRATN